MVLKKTNGALPMMYRAPSNLSPNSTALTCKLLALDQHCALGLCTFEGGGGDVMVHPLTLHVLPKPHLPLWQLGLFPNLSDQPPTPLGHWPTSHSLSLSHRLSYVPITFLYLIFLIPPVYISVSGLQPWLQLHIPNFQTLSLTAV